MPLSPRQGRIGCWFNQEATPLCIHLQIHNFSQFLSKDVQDYFSELTELIERYSWAVSVGYVFHRLEYGHRNTLYCGATKLYGVDKDLARAAVREHMTRERFAQLFGTVFRKQIDGEIWALLKSAEKIRDSVIHGIDADQARIRKALVEVLAYAQEFNVFVRDQTEAAFEPFSDLRGFRGRGESLPRETSRLVLKGLGFTLG